MIYVAKLHLSEPAPDGATAMLFASLDQKHYLPVSREPVAGDEQAIAALFEGDGNFKPMTFGHRAMCPSWWPESAGITRAEGWVVADA